MLFLKKCEKKLEYPDKKFFYINFNEKSIEQVLYSTTREYKISLISVSKKKNIIIDNISIFSMDKK